MLRCPQKRVNSNSNGVVLVGLALIRDWASHDADSVEIVVEGSDSEDDKESIENKVAAVTGALAPFILPMISSLGGISDGDVFVGSLGDDD
jgi:hypothetical protein